MTSDRRFAGIAIVIPGYSIEDIPSDLNEARSTGLLNAIVCAWHPSVIAASNEIPQFRYADVNEMMDSEQILFVPECSEEWLGHDWQPQLEAGNCLVLQGMTERNEWLREIASRFGGARPTPDQELISDFLALGLAWFLVVTLSRRMHYYIDPDEGRLATAVREASTALLDGRIDESRNALKGAFECMLETREQLFPVDSWMLDLCLPPTENGLDALQNTIGDSEAINLMISPAELAELQQNHPEHHHQIVSAVTARKCSLVCGGWHELRSSLGSMSSAYSDLQRALSCSERSSVWGQQRFGLIHALPGLLKLFDYKMALHVALDDGLYPERELAWFNWYGPGADRISASSRLPVAIDSATSILRLPERLAESMQQDSAAILPMARLPEMSTTWLRDLKTIHNWCALLGRFVTFDSLLEELDQTNESAKFEAGEYLGPHLIQASVLKTEAPITGPSELHACRHNLERLAFVQTLTRILRPATGDDIDVQMLDERLQDEEGARLTTDSTEANLDAQSDAVTQLNMDVSAAIRSSSRHLASLLPQGTDAGLLVINSVPFSREATVTWPQATPLPVPSPAILAAYQQDSTTQLRVRIPPGGFLQLVSAAKGEAPIKPSSSNGQSLGEAGLLRNQFFEVLMSPSTGGIADVRFHQQRANRVSQQVAYRYEYPKRVRASDSDETVSVSYATTRCEQQTVVASGPWKGAIESQCVIHDAADGRILFRFRQVTTVERTVPRIKVHIIPDAERCETISGNPWMTYLACRFAWDNEAAVVTRSLLGQACGIQGERFETPDYIEVADDDHRLLIVPHGTPYHRRSGRRMLDCLMVVEGQPVHPLGFTYTLAFDEPFPQRVVADALQPVLAESVSTGVSASGWILGVSSRNTQIARVRSSGRDIVALLQETEGQSARCRLRIARRPQSAVVQKATGEFIESLQTGDDGVNINFAPFELKEVRLTF